MSAQTYPSEPADRVRAIVSQVVEALGVEGEVEVTEDDERILANVDGEEVGLLIGRRGQTIDALQLLCYRAAFRGINDRKRVQVDAAGYRERRRELLVGQADRAASRALESGKEIELEPMGASERKVVHDHLLERSGIETFSEGEEPERCVIVAPLVAE
ncbi:MAG: protein jag [Solirubrobacterales bacterium]